MLQNYIKTGLRTLWKNKTFSTINIFGLALSLAVCMLVVMLVKEAYHYDEFHPESEQIYRIVTEAERKAGFSEPYATSPFPVAEYLVENYNFVEDWVPFMSGLRGEGKTEDKTLPLLGMFSNNQFFETFGFELEKGDENTALTEPYSIILTKESAKRFFGDENPMGQVLAFNDHGDYKVTGVLTEFPGKTHFSFEALASMATLPKLIQEEQVGFEMNDWLDYYSGYHYFKIKEGESIEEIEATLSKLGRSQYADLDLETRDAGYQFTLQNINEITPGRGLSNSMGKVIPSLALNFLTVLGLIMIFCACFNYTNLTVARSLVRAKEIGVRKVIGATRWNVFGQFMGEAILTSLIALLLSYHLSKLLIPGFQQLDVAALFDAQFNEDLILWGWFLLLAIGVGILAGVVPALILSKTKPLSVLQKMNNLKWLSREGLRKSLLTIQFTLSLIFIITVTVLWRQTKFALEMDYGFDREWVMNIPLQGNDYQTVAMQMGQIANVEKVSGISHLMATWQDGSVDIQMEEGAEPRIFRHYFIDHLYLDNSGIEILAGENFPENPTGNQELFVMVNEQFLDVYEIPSPDEAIGKSVILNENTTVTIRGVIEDFNYKPLAYEIEPLVLRYDVSQLRYLITKVKPNDISGTLALMEKSWQKLDAEHPFVYEFYEDTMKEIYSFSRDIIKLITFFGLLAVFIAMLGLFGMATYTIETKAKEISIRKVVGATVSDLVLQLSKGYFLLLGISILFAIPTGYFFGQTFLENFVFRIEIGPMIFLPGILFLVVMWAISICPQAIKASLENPVDALRNE